MCGRARKRGLLAEHFEGYQFSPQAVVKSGSTADLSFYFQRRRLGMISYLGAAKIKYFENKPAAAASAIAISKAGKITWPDRHRGFTSSARAMALTTWFTSSHLKTRASRVVLEDDFPLGEVEVSVSGTVPPTSFPR